MTDRADNGRQADTPWRGKPAVKKPPQHNQMTRAKALKSMSMLERLAGLTTAEYEEYHAEQRARVRQRYGLT